MLLHVLLIWESCKAVIHLKHATCMGEAIGTELVHKLCVVLGVEAQLHNNYGASEACSTWWSFPLEMPPKQRIMPAGWPEPHLHVRLGQLTRKADNIAEVVPPFPESEAEVHFYEELSDGYVGSGLQTSE